MVTQPPSADDFFFLDPAKNDSPVAFPKLSDSPALDLSVIVPAYNEEARLPAMLDETLGYLEARRKAPSPAGNPSLSYEIIVVDDGSRDRTGSLVLDYSRRFSTEHVRLLKMPQNAGKGAAVRAGMLSARGRYSLMADADAATVFEDIERLEAAVADGYDVAIGSRKHLRNAQRDNAVADRATGRDALRAFISAVFNMFVVLVGGVVGLADTQCGFKLYSRHAAVAAFEGQGLQRWAFDVENLYRVQSANLSVVEVPVRWSEVPGSKLSVVKATINMAWDMLRMRYYYTLGRWTLPPIVTK